MDNEFEDQAKKAFAGETDLEDVKQALVRDIMNSIEPIIDKVISNVPQEVSEISTVSGGAMAGFSQKLGDDVYDRS